MTVDLILRVCPNGILVAYDAPYPIGQVIAGGTQWPGAMARVNHAIRRVFVRVSA